MFSKNSAKYLSTYIWYDRYKNLNSTKIYLDKRVYEAHNKRKNKLLPFCEQIGQKQLNNGTNILEKRNKNWKDNGQMKEPVVYVKKQKIRETDPCYGKVHITSIS